MGSWTHEERGAQSGALGEAIVRSADLDSVTGLPTQFVPEDTADSRASQSTRDELAGALADLVELAWRGVPGAEGASFSALASTGPTTLAATHVKVRTLDTVQYTAGQGPCVSAMQENRRVRVEDFATDKRWPLVGDAFTEAGVRSSLSLPLSDSRTTFGGLNMYASVPGAFTESSAHVAGVFARQAVMMLGYLRTLHNERAAHAADHAVAAALQVSLLPTLPAVPGIRCAARYLVSGGNAQIGGDWYDVFGLPDGATGIAVGDVMGHDIKAAAAMAQLRSVLRSYAYEGSRPSVVLERLDRLVQGFEMAELATVVYGRLSLDADGGSLSFSNAGHLPPLVRRPDGTVVVVDQATSTLIGVRPERASARPEQPMRLDRGSLLVLYTDGLIETRDSDIDLRIDLLRQALEALPEDIAPDRACDLLLDFFGPSRADDDIALLVIAIDGTAGYGTAG